MNLPSRYLASIRLLVDSIIGSQVTIFPVITQCFCFLAEEQIAEIQQRSKKRLQSDQSTHSFTLKRHDKAFLFLSPQAPQTRSTPEVRLRLLVFVNC